MQQTYMHAHIHAYLHAYIPTYIRAYMHAYRAHSTASVASVLGVRREDAGWKLDTISEFLKEKLENQ